MKNKLNRRSFIKKSTAIGATSIIGAGIFPNLLFGKEILETIDISVVKGENYFENTLKAVELLGGMKKFVSKDSKVGILINSPWSKPGSYTNPDVALAVLKMCFNAGAKEIFSLESASKDYWYRSLLAEKFDDEINSIKGGGTKVNVEINKGVSLKEAQVAKALLDCDVFINIPISKNHKGTNFTGTMKNMMGACASSTNRFFHNGSGKKGGYEDIEFLSQCIADINLVRKPDLCVVDSTEFILTNGPAGPGEMKKPQKVIAGTDRVAVDALCITIMGLQVEEIIMIKQAHDHGLGEMDLSKLIIKEVEI